MKTMQRLWNEETGAILSAEVMLVASILVIGVVAGLSSLRDSVVTELADLAQALANVNQSYSYGGVQGHHVFNGGGAFVDNTDFCDIADLAAGTFQTAKCVVICNVGVNPAAALAAIGDRIDSYDFSLVATAVSVQRTVGGNLAEVLENIAKTIRERRRICRSKNRA